MSPGAKADICLETPASTHELGRTIGQACLGGERIALIGEMGAGKTAFARGLAEGLGIAPTAVSSPTFTILHEHPDARDGLRLVHADAYRVADLEELEALGWHELLEDGRTVIALEWPDRIQGALPAPSLVVRLEHGDGEQRRFATVHVEESGRHLHAVTPRTCPICEAPMDAGVETFPFCSSRCRMADLGKWFAGGYVVSREIEEDDLVDPDLG